MKKGKLLKQLRWMRLKINTGINPGENLTKTEALNRFNGFNIESHSQYLQLELAKWKTQLTIFQLD